MNYVINIELTVLNWIISSNGLDTATCFLFFLITVLSFKANESNPCTESKIHKYRK